MAVAQYFGIPEGDIPPPQQTERRRHRSLWRSVALVPVGDPAALQRRLGPERARGAQGHHTADNSGFVHSYAAELSRTYQDWAKYDATFNAPDEPPRDHVDVAMAVFSPEQLPVLNGLAQTFCVCDQWYSEVPGPTEPNRLFMHAATSMGLVHNPWEFPITARTIYEDIDEQGTKTWATLLHRPRRRLQLPGAQGADQQAARLEPVHHRSAGSRHVPQLCVPLPAVHELGPRLRQLSARAVGRALRRALDRRRLRGAAREPAVGAHAARDHLRRARRVLRPRHPTGRGDRRS